MKSLQPTRRQLIVATAAAGTAPFVTTRRLFAAEDLDVSKFVIVSDTHLGRKDNESAEKNWRQAIAEINQQQSQFVLHLGDVVDAGRKAQYPVYAETRKLLNKPIYEIPGNHDPVALFKKYVSPEIDRYFDQGGVRFILFNNAHLDSHDGFISKTQIEWLGKQCASAAQHNLKIVMACHVPIHTNRPPDRAWYVKPDEGQTAFYELHKKYSDRILALFHGHFHNGIRGWRDHGNTVESLIPSVCYNQNRNLKMHISEGKASGFFVDELRPGYVVAELGKGKLTLRYKPLGADLKGQKSFSWG